MSNETDDGERTAEEILEDRLRKSFTAHDIARETVQEAYRRGVYVPDVVSCLVACYAFDLQDGRADKVDPSFEELRVKWHQKVTDENDGLRELLADLLHHVYDGGFNCSAGVYSCPYFQECFNWPLEEGSDQYIRRGCKWLVRARKLGIEVD